MVNPTGRVEVLKEGFNLLNKKAITGYGLGSFEYMVGRNPEVAKRLHNESWREAHNEYFQIWFETGLIGLGIMLMGIFTLFKRFLRNIQEDSIYLMSSFIVFLFISLTYFPMRISPLSLYGVIILGILTNKIGEAKC
jgi:O-antigen ligase